MTVRNPEQPLEAMSPAGRKILVMNCHEAWIHQLRHIAAELHIVVGLAGRKVRGWDWRMRPLPSNGRITSLERALAAGPDTYDLAVCHNITDLLDLAVLRVPKLLVLHETLHGRMAQQGATFDPQSMSAMLATYLESVGGHAVGVTPAKGESWGVHGEPLYCCADPADYYEPTYAAAAGIRVANHVTSKRVFLAWDFHAEAFGSVGLTLVGHNPELGVSAARDWDDLRAMFACHRFQVHTADPAYEDGFNMAVVEGLAAGLPLITNVHPTSPVVHGVNGFQARTPTEAREYAQCLVDDIALARRMGRMARDTVRRLFSVAAFRERFERAWRAAAESFGRSAGGAAVLPRSAEPVYDACVGR
ncbi:MAG: hypothetical protein IT356_06270 [Gemmatimonadaceae bacterium]|nr:hypothetical protein [Gemmatimonadaceae bacterium]